MRQWLRYWWFKGLAWTMLACARWVGYGWVVTLPEQGAATVIILATSREDYEREYERACA